MDDLTSELIRRCEARGMCAATTETAAALGLAIDAGMVTLDQVLDLVRSCGTVDELGGGLLMLATTAPAEMEPVAL